jgi:phospholipase C
VRPVRLAVLSAALLVVACASSPRTPSALAGIDHVIVIYQENWSFDGLFGKFPGANGIDGASATSLTQTDKDGRPYATLPPAIDTRPQPPVPDARIPAELPVAPFDLAPYVPPTSRTGNPIHRFYHQQLQINGGRMDRFVAWTNVGGLVMSYYDATNMPLGRLAREFVLADNFFHAAFGGSFLNHMWLVCACTPQWPDAPADLRARLGPDGALLQDGEVTPDGYVVNTAYTVNTPHPARITDPHHLVPNLTLPTIGDRLDAKGVSWAWYAGGWRDALAGTPHARFAYHHQPFAYFARWADGTPAKAKHLRDESDFLSDVAAGRLPAVAFVKPLGIHNEHPNTSEPLTGQQHVAELVQAVRASAIWPRTLIVITYDENGGRWDHVAPPVVDRWGPGVRVPTVIVSPLVKRGHVDHSRYDTTAILKLIETRWGLAPLGARDAAQVPLTGAF